MARMLTRMETGEYFAPNGDVNNDLPIDYIKAKAWELRPRTKVPNTNTEGSAFIDDIESNSDRLSSSGRVPKALINDTKFESETTV